MKQRSGMPYDVVAFSTDENAILWTLEQEGAFHRLMRHAWVNGSIPDEMSALANICKCSLELMEQLWVSLQKSWPLNVRTGRRTNPKQEQERKYVKSIAKKNSDNANKRWESRNATAMRPHSNRNAPLPSPPRPNPTTKNTNTGEEDHSSALADSLPKLAPSELPEFQDFWDGSTRRGSRKEALAEWRRIDFKERLSGVIVAGMKAWMLSEQWQDESKQPHVHRWLKRRGWEEIVPKPYGGNGNGPGRSKPVRETDHEKNRRASEEFLAREVAREMRGSVPDVRENTQRLPGEV